MSASPVLPALFAAGRPRLHPLVRRTLWLLGGAIAVALPFGLQHASQTLYALIGLSAITAIGLSLLMGFAGQVSLGQGAFYAIGAYTAAMLSTPASIFPSGLGIGLNPVLALALAPVVTAAVGAVIGIPLLRLRGHYLAFATLALHLIVLAVIFGQDGLTGGQVGLIGIPPLALAGHRVDSATYSAFIWGCVLVVVLVATNLVRSRAGRGLQALAVNETAAAAAGVNVNAYKLRLFVLSAGLAGLAGGLYAFLFSYVSPDAFALFLSIQFVVIVAVGGLGSVLGAVLGAIVIGLLQHELQKWGTAPGMPVQAPQVLNLGVFGAILCGSMVFFPQGLLPAFVSSVQGRRRRAPAGEAGVEA